MDIMSETTRVCGIDELADDEMMEASVGDIDVLVARVDGDFFATGAHCTHYGAPLSNGVLSEGTVVCPWHHAVFDVRTGDHVEPPGKDCLTAFEVEVRDDEVYVTVPDGAEESRRPDFCEADPDDARHFVIVGGGAAGSAAAETLRREGYAGRITLITEDEFEPYDRPNLSKAYLAGEGDEAWLPLRDSSFYRELDIAVTTGTKVTRFDASANTLELDDGTEVGFTKALLATGGAPNRLPVEGLDGDDVYLLRSRADASSIIEAAQDAESAVIVGSSFIGMEVAASLVARGLEVTVTGLDEIPFEKILGADVGASIQALHAENGVEFALGHGLERVDHDGGPTVVLDDGTESSADLVVVGVGVHPATDFVEGLELEEDGSVSVTERMRVTDDIYAAGDIATFPSPLDGRPVRIEHWRLADQHGRVAGANMAGSRASYDEVPFFWTRQFGTSFKYVGHAEDWDDTIAVGDIDGRDFVVFYLEDGAVAAACGTRGGMLTRVHDLMRRDAMPSPAEIRDGYFD
jgi:NADPH-dependent 2,4-dienoyl-CoA reductase/sulfur reductase-like enzyme/nitrite reductase/ring-hydroxylating ferredoxin subunit